MTIARFCLVYFWMQLYFYIFPIIQRKKQEKKKATTGRTRSKGKELSRYDLSVRFWVGFSMGINAAFCGIDRFVYTCIRFYFSFPFFFFSFHRTSTAVTTVYKWTVQILNVPVPGGVRQPELIVSTSLESNQVRTRKIQLSTHVTHTSQQRPDQGNQTRVQGLMKRQLILPLPVHPYPLRSLSHLISASPLHTPQPTAAIYHRGQLNTTQAKQCQAWSADCLSSQLSMVWYYNHTGMDMSPGLAQTSQPLRRHRHRQSV